MNYLNSILFLLIATGQLLKSEIEIVRCFNIKDFGNLSTNSILNYIKERKEGKNSNGGKSYGYLKKYLSPLKEVSDVSTP